MKTKEQFLDDLMTKNPTIKRKLSLIGIYSIWFVVSTLITFLTSLLIIGHREDIRDQLFNIYFNITLISIVLTVLSSTFASFYLSTPRTKLKQNLLYFLLFTVLLWLSIVFYLMATEIIALDISRLLPQVGLTCTKNIALMGTIPVISIFYILKKEFPTKLSQVSFLATLACFSLGAFGTHLTCTTNNASHILVWHLLPILLLSVIGSYFGKKILKW